MDISIKQDFMEKWAKYLPNNDLPIACYYADTLDGAIFSEKPKENAKGYTCIFGQLASVRAGKTRAFNQDNLGCFGAAGMFGFTELELTDEYVEFLTEKECFKKNRYFVERMIEDNPYMTAPGKYLTFKRWDLLTEEDVPQVVFFFAKPDTIGGLHMLANWDYETQHGVISPFGSGCESLVGFAMKQALAKGEQCVLGLFDIPARGCVAKDIMTFSAPYERFKVMVDNMDNTFLNTHIWEPLKKRMDT